MSLQCNNPGIWMDPGNDDEKSKTEEPSSNH